MRTIEGKEIYYLVMKGNLSDPEPEETEIAFGSFPTAIEAQQRVKEIITHYRGGYLTSVDYYYVLATSQPDKYLERAFAVSEDDPKEGAIIMAEQHSPKTVGFWKSIDRAFEMLVQLAFDHCFTLDELKEAAQVASYIFDQQYPNNPGKDKLKVQLNALYSARKDWLLRLNDPENSPVIVASDEKPTGFNSEA